MIKVWFMGCYLFLYFVYDVGVLEAHSVEFCLLFDEQGNLLLKCGGAAVVLVDVCGCSIFRARWVYLVGITGGSGSIFAGTMGE